MSLTTRRALQVTLLTVMCDSFCSIDLQEKQVLKCWQRLRVMSNI